MIPQIGTIGNNQIVVITNEGKMFFSYDQLIGIKKDGKLYLTDLWDYSRTTLKYLKIAFGLDLTKSEIQKKLDNGEFGKYR